jgi:hypothetical protein
MMRLDRTTTRQLPVELTREELLDRASTLAWAMKTRADEEVKQAAEKAEMKASLDEMKGEEASVARIVRDKAEPRPVKVAVVMDDDQGEVLEIREDTGEVLSTRAQSDHERQQKIDDGDPIGRDILRAIETFRSADPFEAEPS